jgi:hypothetical protein
LLEDPLQKGIKDLVGIRECSFDNPRLLLHSNLDFIDYRLQARFYARRLGVGIRNAIPPDGVRTAGSTHIDLHLRVPNLLRDQLALIDEEVVLIDEQRGDASTVVEVAKSRGALLLP